MSSIWDDPDFKPSDSEFVKFTNVGDSVAGHITSIGRKTWDDGSVSPQLDITDDQGEDKILTAGQVRLKLALAEQRPEIGDHLSVTLTEVQRRPGGKTLKVFDVTVIRGGKAKAAAGAKATPAPADDSEPPF